MVNTAVRTFAVILVLLLLGPSAFAERKDISLAAADGTALKATYFSAAQPGPAIMLLHMCDGGRKAWDHLASSLAEHGFHVLSVDYRGFGESGGRRFADLDEAGRREAQAKWPGDLEIALAYLLTQAGVDGTRIGAGGASCGVNNAIGLAMRHPEVKSLVFLSGVADTPGLEYIRNADWLPVFAAASDDDGAFVPYQRWIVEFSGNPQSRFVQYHKGGHGTDMFAAQKELEPAIVDWFTRTLLQPATPAATARSRKTSAAVQFWRALTAPEGAARAAALLQDAKQRDPKSVPFPLYAVDVLTRERLDAGRLWDAVQFAKLNAAAYPESVFGPYRLAQLYTKEGNREQAIRSYEQAVQLAKTDPGLTQQQRDMLAAATDKALRELRATAVNLSGRWKGQIELKDSAGQSNTVPAYTDFKHDENAVTGSFGPDEKTHYVITDGRLDSGRLTFEVAAPTRVFKFTLTLADADHLEGSVEARDQKASGKVGLVRVSAAP